MSYSGNAQTQNTQSMCDSTEALLIATFICRQSSFESMPEDPGVR